MEFMKTEGDRSGVEIPDHVHKAANIIHAMIKKLEGKETYTLEEIYDAQSDINRALLHLNTEYVWNQNNAT